MKRVADRLKFRTWLLIENTPGINNRYVMLYSGDRYGGNYNNFPFSSDNARDVMQVTGLKDIGGKDIYEKDIVSINNTKGTIFYNISAGQLQILYKDGKLEVFDIKKAPLCKVVGNIYENPLVLIE